MFGFRKPIEIIVNYDVIIEDAEGCEIVRTTYKNYETAITQSNVWQAQEYVTNTIKIIKVEKCYRVKGYEYTLLHTCLTLMNIVKGRYKEDIC